MIVRIEEEGANLDAGYLARRAAAATKALSLKHMSSALCAQLVLNGHYAPPGRGQSRTELYRARLKLADTFCKACSIMGIDADAPSDKVRDIVCYMSPGESTPPDIIATLVGLQDFVRMWAIEKGSTVMLGLHALELNGRTMGMRDAHLHMVGLDCASELNQIVISWIDNRSDCINQTRAMAESELLYCG